MMRATSHIIATRGFHRSMESAAQPRDECMVRFSTEWRKTPTPRKCNQSLEYRKPTLVFSVRTRSAAGWVKAYAQEGMQEAKNERHCCLCNTTGNRDVDRFESAPERSLGLRFRPLSLLPAPFLRRRRNELLSQFDESVRISGVMHSKSPISGCGWRTQMEAQKQAAMALVVMCVAARPPGRWWRPADRG